MELLTKMKTSQSTTVYVLHQTQKVFLESPF